MPQLTVTIGISVRPDQGGDAHTYDNSAMQSAQHLFDNREFKFGLGPQRFTVRVQTVQVPRVDSASDGPALVQARSNFDALNMVALKQGIEGVDLLYIPGGPVATPSQDKNVHKMKAPTDPNNFKRKEADSRDSFESRLIEIAMNRCIPVLAVCAGSWRLLEACGGKVRELTDEDAKKHRNKMDMWGIHHGLKVEDKPRGLIKSATETWTPRTAEKNHKRDFKIDYEGANTTHWAVADEADGKLVDRFKGQKPAPTDPTRVRLRPSEYLQVIAREPTLGTVEGFESQFGLPLMGLQWHPESNLQGQPGAQDQLALAGGMVAFSREIFRLMILSAVSAQLQRQSVVPSLREALSAGVKLKPIDPELKKANDRKQVEYATPRG